MNDKIEKEIQDSMKSAEAMGGFFDKLIDRLSPGMSIARDPIPKSQKKAPSDTVLKLTLDEKVRIVQDLISHGTFRVIEAGSSSVDLLSNAYRIEARKEDGGIAIYFWSD